MDIKLFETSAKENINVEEMFRAVTELVLRSKKDQQNRLNNPADMKTHESGIKLSGSTRPGPHKPSKNKSSCCK
jgi:GTPase SAR1 family protein